jgi:hypothetical protein
MSSRSPSAPERLQQAPSRRSTPPPPRSELEGVLVLERCARQTSPETAGPALLSRQRGVPDRLAEGHRQRAPRAPAPGCCRLRRALRLRQRRSPGRDLEPSRAPSALGRRAVGFFHSSLSPLGLAGAWPRRSALRHRICLPARPLIRAAVASVGCNDAGHSARQRIAHVDADRVEPLRSAELTTLLGRAQLMRSRRLEVRRSRRPGCSPRAPRNGQTVAERVSAGSSRHEIAGARRSPSRRDR